MKHGNKLVLLSVVAFAGGVLAGCNDTSKNSKGDGSDEKVDSVEVSAVQKVINEAQEMDEADLYKKAVDEINGKSFTVVANSSRMKDAFPAWVDYINKNYKTKLGLTSDFQAGFSTTQPKNNQIFNTIKGDVTGANHSISMTLIQDGSQISTKMIKTGYLLNYIPKEWKASGASEAADGHPLALQSLSKVFAYNSIGTAEGAFNNVFDFTMKDDGTPFSTQFMSPASEPVGANMLYMLTNPTYTRVVKEAYDNATDTQKKIIDAIIEEDNKTTFNCFGDKPKTVVAAYGASGIKAQIENAGLNADPNAKYALAWEFLFLKNYQVVTDDGPICTNLTQKSAAGAGGLLVYSKFRSITESDTVTLKDMRVAAYDNGYSGFGGYMYKHYLQVLSTSPYPWTSCAIIQFMTCHAEGFKPWGKDMGGYSANPQVQAKFDHSRDGYNEDGTTIDYPIKNDKGYDWWTKNEAGKGRLVLEDGAYCSSVATAMSDWISYLR